MPDDGTGYGFMAILGPVLLAAVMVYGVIRNARRSPRQRARTEQATKRLYEETDHR